MTAIPKPTLSLGPDGLRGGAQGLEPLGELHLRRRGRRRHRRRWQVAVPPGEQGLAEARKGALPLRQVLSMGVEPLGGLLLALRLARELALPRCELLFRRRRRALTHFEVGDRGLPRHKLLLAPVELGRELVQPRLALRRRAPEHVELRRLPVELHLPRMEIAFSAPQVGLPPPELLGLRPLLRLVALHASLAACQLRLLLVLLAFEQLALREPAPERVEPMLPLASRLEPPGDAPHARFEMLLALRELAFALGHARRRVTQLPLRLDDLVEPDCAGVSGPLDSGGTQLLRGLWRPTVARFPSHAALDRQ